MSRMTEKPMRERHFLRFFMRSPIALYRARLGWIFGERFLMLSHIGRKSGLTRYVVLEVVDRDSAAGIYYIAAAWGEKADWYRNLHATPQAMVQGKNHRFAVHSKTVSKEEAESHFLTYAQKYPVAFTQLIKTMLGEGLPPSQETCERLAQVVPLVSLTPIKD